MSAIARINDNGKAQLLADHLRGTAYLACEFASVFGASQWGKAAGLLHDDGKYLDVFQERIRNIAEGKPAKRVIHSTPGAVYATKHITNPPGAGKLIAYCIAGHHGGLPDGKSGTDDTNLASRLKRGTEGKGYLAEEISILEKPRFFNILCNNESGIEQFGFSAAFFVRMLYSCLVDADFLDTEAFMDGKKTSLRGEYPHIEKLSLLLDTYLKKIVNYAEKTEVNRQRKRILEECRKAAELEPGLFSLTVPTGGGKTLSSIAFALHHALKYDLQRVIYVIPYTSIIEQTADVFRNVFGPEAVVEHHSSYDPLRHNGIDQKEIEDKRRLAIENWDAPITITTNVQFFESFFSNRSSKTRKLHNIARSVVILDEAQMLPVPLLQPTLEVIKELAQRYGTTLVLCTATQPALNKRQDFVKGLTGVREMMRDPKVLEKSFQRVKAVNLGRLTDENLSEKILNSKEVLCIVNTRRHARVLYELTGKEDGNYHLNALMCPVHRSTVLKTIQKRLKNGQTCRVISTQLVEAGVDLDFPVVFRVVAGLDSIVQAAGRCNREGKLAEKGLLYVFSSLDNPPPWHFRQNAQITEILIEHDEYSGNILSSDAVEEYFRELYWLKSAGSELDKKGILSMFSAGFARGDFPFKTAASLYRIIDEDTIPVIVPWDDRAAYLVKDIENTSGSIGKILRAIQPYTIQVYPRILAELKLAGFVYSPPFYDDLYIMSKLGMNETYDENLGLSPDIKEFHVVENLMI